MSTNNIIQVHKTTFDKYRSLMRNTRDDSIRRKINNLLIELTIPPSSSLDNMGNMGSMGSLSNSSANSSPATTPTTASRKAPQFASDFSRASQQRKFITSYLNKLTEKNKESIFKKIENDIKHYSPDEITKAFDQIFVSLRSHKDTVEMYYNIFCLFDEGQLHRYVQDNLIVRYIKEKEWLPPSEYRDTDVYNAGCDYDLYCAFCSWKNGAIAISKFFAMYLDRDTRRNLISRFEEDIHQNLSLRVIIDPVLEQLECLLQPGDDFDRDVIRRLTSLKKEDIPLSSYFKIHSF